MSCWTTVSALARTIAKWLAHKDRRRWNMHFTDLEFWLNLIERWFQESPTKRCVRSFSSVADLTAAITTGRYWNAIQALRMEGHRRRHHRQSSTVDATPYANQSQTDH